MKWMPRMHVQPLHDGSMHAVLDARLSAAHVTKLRWPCTCGGRRACSRRSTPACRSCRNWSTCRHAARQADACSSVRSVAE
jgi:hypothetical protein